MNDRRDPLDVPCPRCNMRAGDQCRTAPPYTTRRGAPTTTHEARWKLAASSWQPRRTPDGQHYVAEVVKVLGDSRNPANGVEWWDVMVRCPKCAALVGNGLGKTDPDYGVRTGHCFESYALQPLSEVPRELFPR